MPTAWWCRNSYLKQKDANWKLVEVVTVANVDDEDRVGNSLLHAWELRLGNNDKILFRLWAQGFEVEVQARLLSRSLGQYYAADILQRLWSWILVEMLKLGLVNILSFKFSRDGDVWLEFWNKYLVKILKMKFDQDLCLNLWYDPIGYFGKMNSTLGSVVPLAMF